VPVHRQPKRGRLGTVGGSSYVHYSWNVFPAAPGRGHPAGYHLKDGCCRSLRPLRKRLSRSRWADATAKSRLVFFFFDSGLDRQGSPTQRYGLRLPAPVVTPPVTANGPQTWRGHSGEPGAVCIRRIAPEEGRLRQGIRHRVSGVRRQVPGGDTAHVGDARGTGTYHRRSRARARRPDFQRGTEKKPLERGVGELMGRQSFASTARGEEHFGMAARRAGGPRGAASLWVRNGGRPGVEIVADPAADLPSGRRTPSARSVRVLRDPAETTALRAHMAAGRADRCFSPERFMARGRAAVVGDAHDQARAVWRPARRRGHRPRRASAYIRGSSWR